MGLELGECHFDGIEVWAVRGQEEQPCALSADEALGLLAFVAREVVEDDHVAGPEGGCELGLDIGVEDRPVHRRVNDPGCYEAIAFKARHEGLRAPMAKWGLAIQPLALGRAPAQPGHLGVGAGLIDEDQPALLLAQDGLAAIFPFGPRLGQLRPVLLGRPQSFF